LRLQAGRDLVLGVEFGQPAHAVQRAFHRLARVAFVLELQRLVPHGAFNDGKPSHMPPAAKPAA
jgi:hypothetical protein